MTPLRLASYDGRARLPWVRLAAASATSLLFAAAACGGSPPRTQSASSPVVTVGGGAPEPEDRPGEGAKEGGAPAGEIIFEGKLNPPLRLEATVTAEGVWLSTSSGPIATGCLRLGDGVSIPARGEELDKPAIRACARRIKRSRAEFVGETAVTVYGLATVKYEAVIGVIDALRGDEEEELFPDVTVAVKR